jgi:hypothetical protein
VLLFSWRVIPENNRCVIGIRIGDEDTRATREVDRVGPAGLVGSEHAGDPAAASSDRANSASARLSNLPTSTM